MLESMRMRRSAVNLSIEVRMLGGFEVRDERGGPVTFPVRKAEGLLGLLALHLGRPVARDKVCGMLWPDVREAQARHSLRQTLLCVRKALPNAVHGNSRSLTLDAGRVRVDVSELERQLEVGTLAALVEVSRSYRGDLLEGLTIGEQPFEQWLSFERERVRSAVARGLTRLIDLHVAAGELAEAASACSQVLQLDPLRESIHRSLMRLHAQQGRRSHALQHYQNLVRMLRANLGTDPDKETQHLYAELERLAEPDSSTAQLSAASSSALVVLSAHARTAPTAPGEHASAAGSAERATPLAHAHTAPTEDSQRTAEGSAEPVAPPTHARAAPPASSQLSASSSAGPVAPDAHARTAPASGPRLSAADSAGPAAPHAHARTASTAPGEHASAADSAVAPLAHARTASTALGQQLSAAGRAGPAAPHAHVGTAPTAQAPQLSAADSAGPAAPHAHARTAPTARAPQLSAADSTGPAAPLAHARTASTALDQQLSAAGSAGPAAPHAHARTAPAAQAPQLSAADSAVAQPHRARAVPAALNPDPPAVARSEELAALHSAQTQASSALWLIQGEAGVGKTHLSNQFASEVAARGGRVLRGRCFESEQVLPLSCWLNLLEDAQVAKDPLLAALPSESRRELARLLPELGEAAPPRAAEGALALFRVLELLLALLAEGGELLVILEDLHWADEMSLRTLCYLTRRQARARSCFVLASARSEDIADPSFLPTALAELEREQLLQRIKLEPFSREHTRDLALQWAERLALKTSHAGWVDRVWALSEGNALVIVESAHALAHVLEMDLDRLSVPERVRALIRRRIAQCSPDARELAGLAAAYGRELDPALLQGALPAPQLVAASEELIQAKLMRASGERIAFTHDRIRETLYEEMLPARRRLLHSRIARALELSAGDSELETSALGQVGYHHAKAGNAESAIPYLVRFSEHARRSHALGETMAALEQALKCALQLPAANRSRAVVKVILRLAFSLSFLGRFQDLLRKLEEHAGMLEGLAEHELVGSYHFWWGLGLTLDGRRAQAEQHAELAREHAVASDDRRMRGYAHNLSAHLSTFAGRFEEGVAHAKSALELLLADGGTLGEAVMFAFVNLTTSHLMTGNWRMAQSVAQQAETYAQGAENKRGRAMAALCSGFVHAYTHRWDLVLAAAQRSCEASNTPFTLGPAMSLIAMAQLARGEFAPAITLLETMVKRLEKLSMRGWHGVLATLLAEACLRSGDLSRARQLASEAAETAQALGDRLTAGIALLVRGRAAKGLSDLESAQSDLYAALNLCEAAQGSISTAYTLRAIAELELALRHPKRARAALQRAQDIFSAHSLDIPALDTAARVSSL